ncbi:CsgG/HfaB family protein [Haliangium sp.]|uniref:CsgG/HfaB family protein n=1 Tax=Haliangium sp. TaxID=2663208 RepID=UPI003D0CD079
MRLAWVAAWCALILAMAAPLPAHADGDEVAGAELRVAVLEFGNASSERELDSLGKGLQSMLTTDLTRASALSLVERARLRDLEGELELGRSGMIDGATAARIGKLAGATHLLGGTFTVHGASMRIDARLFAVETGRVLLAEEITGDKDAFFELEKALIRKLLRALGVKLAPAERTRVAQIHTADFEAFRRFSEGVDHFDDKRYQEAIAALEQATALDAEFDLARVTLGEYQRIAADIRTRAASIAASRVEVERLARDRQAQLDAAVVTRLFEIAERPGDDARIDRLTALMLLHRFYGDGYGTSHGRYIRFQHRQDTFAVDRMAAVILGRYVAEAQRAFPAVPLLPPPVRDELAPKEFAPEAKGAARLPDFDQAFAKARTRLTSLSARSEDQRRKALLGRILGLDRYLPDMLVDGRQELSLRELFLSKAAGLGIGERDQRDALLEMAHRYRNLGDHDRSTALLARVSRLTQDPRTLERIAAEVDLNRTLAELRRRTRLRRQLDEYLRAPGRWGDGTLRVDPALFQGRQPSAELLHELMEGREVRPMQSWYLADEPCSVFMGEYWLLTGERLDPRRSKSLRYYYTERMSDEDALVACGAGPRRDLDASFTLDFRPADDFWPRHASPRQNSSRSALALDPGRPEVGFVFGLRDLRRNYEEDPASGKSMILQPTRGLMVRVTADAVELVALGDPGPSEDLRRPRMTTRVLARERLAKAKPDTVRVRVRVRGRAVQVTVGRAKHRFTLPRELVGQTAGFIGFHLRGRGYAEIVNPTVRTADK